RQRIASLVKPEEVVAVFFSGVCPYAISMCKKQPLVEKVYAIEIIPELCAFGKANIAKFNFAKKGTVKTFCQDGSQGLPEYAPFDRILVSASASELPQELISQLAESGKLAAPIGQSIWLYIKKGRRVEKKEYPGFLFVPLIP
ncbi:MAG: hypothetical protein HY001_03575, partial [Candidatus Portnoybacteria bacterium]|nr:hypothetical protein [Candidatus Portnoybacteria bacterium]